MKLLLELETKEKRQEGNLDRFSQKEDRGEIEEKQLYAEKVSLISMAHTTKLVSSLSGKLL